MATQKLIANFFKPVNKRVSGETQVSKGVCVEEGTWPKNRNRIFFFKVIFFTN